MDSLSLSFCMKDIGLFDRARTASDMDGTLHTDLAGFENIRDIKKVLYNHFNNFKSLADF